MQCLPMADTAALVPLCRVPALVLIRICDPDFPEACAEAAWLTGSRDFGPVAVA